MVKLGQSLYREKPGQDKYRPTQSTPISNFFLAGSYTYQVRVRVSNLTLTLTLALTPSSSSRPRT